MTKPNSTLYLDDPEEGLSRDTSHPRFVQLAADDFYYNGSDDFSPFGSDDAHDALSALQDCTLPRVGSAADIQQRSLP